MANTQKPIKATLDSSDDSVKTQKPILIQLDEIPTPEAGDAGKALVVNAEETGYELATVGGGGSGLAFVGYGFLKNKSTVSVVGGGENQLGEDVLNVYYQDTDGHNVSDPIDFTVSSIKQITNVAHLMVSSATFAPNFKQINVVNYSSSSATAYSNEEEVIFYLFK